MSQAEGQFLQKRAQEFLENAQGLLDEGKYALAAFNFEQAAQLFLKHALFLQLGDFPKTHSLKRLLKELGEATQREKLDSFAKENADVLANLENAYFTARYFPVEFEVREVKNMENFVNSLLVLLKQPLD